VGVIKALSELFGKKLTNQELFDLSYKTVLDVQGVGSGFDLAAAIWGGTIYFVTGGKKIVPLNIKELPLIVGYTGIKADTPTLVRQVAKFYKDHRKLVGIIFDTIASLTKEARKALKKSDIKKLGELMDVNQGLLDTLGVNSKELSKLIFTAREGGAYGAKLSGAGGGDCMIALSSQSLRKKVEASIEKAEGTILRVKMNADGVKIER
jgi:mevalonate kinase